jgi:hypothetical protein
MFTCASFPEMDKSAASRPNWSQIDENASQHLDRILPLPDVRAY